MYPWSLSASVCQRPTCQPDIVPAGRRSSSLSQHASSSEAGVIGKMRSEIRGGDDIKRPT